MCNLLMVEAIKEVIRSRDLKKYSQWNVEKKKDNWSNKTLSRNLIFEQHGTHWQTEGERRCSQRVGNNKLNYHAIILRAVCK
jgi:hypothetical protein